MQTTKIGRRGTLVIPTKMRKKLGLEEGALVIAEEKDGGLLLRPAVAVPVEYYSSERKAEFLLSNTIDEQDYQIARKEVLKMKLNPDKIPHFKAF